MVIEKKYKIIELLRWGEDYLRKNGKENSRKESEWFLSHILKCKRIDLYLSFDKFVDKKYLKIFKLYIERRQRHEPFQYIINKAPFYGRDFFVNNNVLIPRPETEVIIELLKQKDKVKSILDIGTGSGCLAITASLEQLSDHIVGIDNSKLSIEIARQNSTNHKTNNVYFFTSNILTELPRKKYDIIISNPPYINKLHLKNLAKEIKNYEPYNALTDQHNGLTFYKRFSNILSNILNKNGTALLEFGGEKQRDAINKIFYKYKLSFHKDLNNESRVVEVSYV